MDSAKKIVHELYPDAFCEKRPSSEPGGKDRWVVKTGTAAGSRDLSEGESEMEAWVKGSDQALLRLRKPSGVSVSEETKQDAAIMGRTGDLEDAIDEAKKEIERGKKK